MNRLSAAVVVLMGSIVGFTSFGGKLEANGRPVEKSQEGPSSKAPGRPVQPPAAEELGLAAVERASKAGKYLFVFFYKEENSQTSLMRRVFEAALAKVPKRADSVAIDVRAGSEKGIVDKFQVHRAPMPLVLVLAPNGAVTGGFPVRFKEKQLLGAFASPGMEKCLKALQENKFVFVCIQNERTRSNLPAMEGVKAFKADKKYAARTEIVVLDPSSKAEARTLAQLRINTKTDEALTVLLTPPGTLAAQFAGVTRKATLEAAVLKACGSCAGGT